MKLQSRKWKSFPLGQLFEVRRGNAKDIRNKDSNNDIALISAIDNNNGLYKFTTHENAEMTFVNVYTVNNNGNGVGLAYFHKYKFIASTDVSILMPKYKQLVNIDIAHFVITMIKKQKTKFNYGYKMNNDRMLKTIILLPITPSSDIDFKFMKNYVKQLRLISNNDYLNYAHKRIEQLHPKIETKIETATTWVEFGIRSIFSTYQRGKRLIRNEHIPGDTPYVSSTSDNNGIDSFISNDSDTRKFNNCLSLANSGSVGSCFYHPYEYIASDHVTNLKSDLLDEPHYLFIATLLKRLSEKYNFNREINDLRIAREKIMLPINDDGNIDLAYIEHYIKQILISKYSQYVNYLNNQK